MKQIRYLLQHFLHCLEDSIPYRLNKDKTDKKDCLIKIKIKQITSSNKALGFPTNPSSLSKTWAEEADLHDMNLKSVCDFNSSSCDTDHFLKQTQWTDRIPVYQCRVLDDFKLGSETSVYLHKMVKKAAYPVWDSVTSLFMLVGHLLLVYLIF